MLKKLTAPKKVIPTENQEQRALVKWLSFHPILRDFFYKNDNEGQRTIAQGWNAKMMGLRPGVSDLFINYPANGFHGLYIEVKRNRKYSPSEMKSDTWLAQIKFLENAKSVGYAGDFCYGWEDGKRIIESYLRTE